MKSLKDIFLSGDHYVGLGLSTFADIDNQELKEAKNIDDIWNSQQLIDVIVNNKNLLVPLVTSNYTKNKILSTSTQDTFFSQTSINNVLSVKGIEYSVFHNNQYLLQYPLNGYNSSSQSQDPTQGYFLSSNGSSSTTNYSHWFSLESFDLTKVKEIIFKINIHYSYSAPQLYVGVSNNTQNNVSFASCTSMVCSNKAIKEFNVDVSSLSGAYFLKYCVIDDRTDGKEFLQFYIQDIIFRT